jgi:hypothetical protein
LNEKTFNDDLCAHGLEMNKLLSRLAEVQDQAKLISVQDSVIEIMRVVSESAIFINSYLSRGAFGA